MLKELLTIGICALAANGSATPNQSDLDVMNSTDYLISVFDNDSKIQYDFFPRSESQIPQGYDFEVMVQKDGDQSMAKPDFYMFEVYPDNETEIHLGTSVWSDQGPYFETYVTLNSNTTALQFYEKVSLAGEVYYIEQPDLSNMNNGIGNLLPEGSTADLQNGNSTISIVKLTWDKDQVTKGIIGYGRFIINDLTTIASNSTTGRAPDDPSQLNQLMLYYGNYTNKITFTSGYYTRSWTTQGYTDQIPMLSKTYQPYASYSSAGNTGISYTPISTGVTLVALSFEALNSLFGYLVFPGLTLGMLLLVPTFLGIMFAIIKLVKKG